MKFYKFLKQQYDDYKKYYDDYKNKGYIIAPTACSICPCRTLIDKVIDPHKQIDCTNDIIYLANKYNLHGFDASLCDDCVIVSLKIAKKMTERSNRI